MKTKTILAGVVACMALSVSAQKTSSEVTSPKGKAIVRAFADFHANFGTQSKERGFNLSRTYLGYQYTLSKTLSVRAVMDIGKSKDVTDLHRIAYLKHAMLSWKQGKWEVHGGLISTTQFKFQESYWGYRYIHKSFQDEYKFGSSADLGVSLAYSFADWLSADAIVVNGEGYKKVQTGNGLNYGLGTTITPLKGFQLRLYGGVNQRELPEQKDIVNLSGFAGYKSALFSLGAEYALMQNRNHLQGQQLYGYSLFGSLALSPASKLYTRLDNLYANNNEEKGAVHAAAIIGAEFGLGSYLRLAPNFRATIPHGNTKNTGYSVYLNCYFGL